MTDQAVSAVKAGCDALGRGDVPAVLGAMTQDIEGHEAEGLPYGGGYHGPPAIAENVFGPLTTDVPGFALTPEEYTASGDTAVAVVRYTGTGKSTGKELDIHA